MDNHVHFIAIPTNEFSLARTFNTAHMVYSQHAHRIMNTQGHLWQGRFFSCILDDRRLLTALRYVEQNPCRSQIVNKPWDWKWSSAAEHAGMCNTQGLLDNVFSYIDIKQNEWKDFLLHKEGNHEIEELRKHTKTGHPIGSESFLKELSLRLNRPTVALPRGRPYIKI